MPDGAALSAAYRRAGDDLLGHRLMDMVKVLHTPEDVAAHNAVCKEVYLMIKDNQKNTFYQYLAGLILGQEKRVKRTFAKWLAESILPVGKG